MNFNWMSVGSFFNFFSAFVLGIFVYLKNKKAEANKAFSSMSMFVALWGFCFFVMAGTVNKEHALFCARLMNLAAIIIPITFFHWILASLELTRKRGFFLRFAYGLNLLILVLAILFPSKFVGTVRMKLSYLPGVWFTSDPGFLYFIYTFLFFLYPFYSCFLLFRAWRGLTGSRGQKIKFMLIGAIVGFIAGGDHFFTRLRPECPYLWNAVDRSLDVLSGLYYYPLPCF